MPPMRAVRVELAAGQLRDPLQGRDQLVTQLAAQDVVVGHRAHPIRGGTRCGATIARRAASPPPENFVVSR